MNTTFNNTPFEFLLSDWLNGRDLFWAHNWQRGIGNHIITNSLFFYFQTMNLLRQLFSFIFISALAFSIDAKIDTDAGTSSKTRKVQRHSGRLLGKPDPVKCSRRPRQYQDRSSGHYYFFSEDTNLKAKKNTFFVILM